MDGAMSEKFDPYYKWLGIPPKDQPPHHYRLLGLELLESDAEVIDAAANRLMEYLQGMAVGRNHREGKRSVPLEWPPHDVEPTP